MALCMGYGEQYDLGSTMDGGQETRVWQTAPVRSRRRRGSQAASARALGRDGRQRPGRPYERFESITVRAAARVLHLQQRGVVSAGEIRHLLRELAAMDAHATRGAVPSLARVARRRVGRAGIGGKDVRR
jgi:hypothetical protein